MALKTSLTFSGMSKIRDKLISRPGKLFHYLVLAAGLILISGSIQAQNINPGRLAKPGVPGDSGDLDPAFAGFAGNGKTAASPIDIRHIALQADGKIIAGGRLDDTFALARFNGNGSLDQTFGTNGVVTTTILDSQSNAGVTAIAVQSDGQIVAAGWVFAGGQSNFAVVRYNPDGSLDNSFSGNGKTAPDFDGGDDGADALAIDSNGRILVAGSVWDKDSISPDDYDIGVFRFNPNGSLDKSFSADGKTNIGYNNNDSARAIAIQPDGKIILGGTREESCVVPLCPSAHVYCFDGHDVADFDFALVRLNLDGSPDEDFDDDGKLSTEMDGWDCVYSLAVQPDGKIIAAGENWPHGIAIARYWPGGELDDSFGENGRVYTNFSGTYSSARSVVVQPDGKITIAGIGDDKFALFRYREDGALDSSFGDGGMVFTDFLSGHWEGAFALEMQDDGRFVVSGYDFNLGEGGYLARYLPDGSLDVAGRQLVAFGFPIAQEQAQAMLAEPGGKLVMAGYLTESNDRFALARLNSDGTLDQSFGDDGRVISRLVVDGRALALARNISGDIVAGGYVTTGQKGKDFMIIRFDANGAFECIGFADFDGGDDQINALAFQEDTKIIAVGQGWGKGTNDTNFAAARFNANCTIDSTFGSGGKTMINKDGDEIAHGVLVPTEGTIILGGYADNDIFLVGLTHDGDVDNSFGVNGQTLTDLGGSELVYAMTALADGRIIVAGQKGLDQMVARFSPDGLLDTTFGINGSATANYATIDRAYAVTARPDGTIITAGCGYYRLIVPYIFEVVQFRPNGVLDSDFSNDGIATTSFGGLYNCAKAVAFTQGYKIVAAGYSNGNGDSNFALARFLTTPPPLQGYFKSYLPLNLN